MKILRNVTLVAAALYLGPLAASAQDAWPSKPVEIVVPYAPGGASDTLGRLAGQGLSEALKQQFPIQNKPGGAGTVGSDIVAKSAPDGYSLVVSGVGSHVVAPAINPSVSFDPIKDFTHLAVLGGPPSVVVVNASMNIKTVAELDALLKNPVQPISYASPGAGTQGHLVGEYFKTLAGVEMTHIPYRGAGAAMADVMSGVVQVGSFTLSSAAAQIRAGTFVPLAVTSAERVAEFPDVPTFAEAGYPDLVAKTWFALSGPKDLPAETATRINQIVNDYFQTPEVKNRLAQDAIEFTPMSLEEVSDFFKEETERWAPVAKKSGAHIE